MITTDILWQVLAGLGLVVLAMYLGIRLVRFAATFCLALLLLGACMFAVTQIITNQWSGWSVVIPYSAGTGLAAALLSIPLLPFTNFWKKE